MNIKKISCILTCIPILFACTKEPVYSLKETEIDVEVGDKNFDPLVYLLKDGTQLSETERKQVKTGNKIDVNELGEFIFRFPEHALELRIHVKDTTKPTLSIISFSIKQGNVFTWNEETLGYLKAQVRDNYDTSELLKKSLYCDSVDTTKVGKQKITCQISDSSGNIASATTDVIIQGNE